MANLHELAYQLGEVGDLSEDLDNVERPFIEEILENMDKIRNQILEALLRKLSEAEINAVRFFGEYGENTLFDFMRDVAPVDGAEQLNKAVRNGVIKQQKGRGETKYNLTAKGEKLYELIRKMQR